MKKISKYYEEKVKKIKDFDYTLDFKNIDFRKNPELYRIGRGEQGVLMVEPYKSEILPNWRFKNPEIATISSKKIYAQFLKYLENDDFIGADMARKFLQMGYTRARRYANHASGKKYKNNPQLAENEGEEKEKRKAVLPQENDALTGEKAQAARIFYGIYLKARENEKYKKMKEEFKQKFG